MNDKYFSDMGMIWHNIFSFSREALENGNFPLSKMGIYDITILHLVDCNKSIQVKDVCKELGVPKSTMTSILKRLESNGYIIKQVAENDKRGFCLEVTDKGNGIISEHIKYENMVYEYITDGLTERECETLIKLLKKGCKIGR